MSDNEENGVLTEEMFGRVFAKAYLEHNFDQKAAKLDVIQQLGKTEFLSSRTSPNKVMQLDGVKDAIKEILQAEAGVSEERLTKEMSDIAFSNIADFVEVKSGKIVMKQAEDEDADAAANRALRDFGHVIRSIKNGTHGVEVTLVDKLKAQEYLSRAFQSFSRKQEHHGPGGKELAIAPTLVLFDKDSQAAMESGGLGGGDASG